MNDAVNYRNEPKERYDNPRKQNIVIGACWSNSGNNFSIENYSAVYGPIKCKSHKHKCHIEEYNHDLQAIQCPVGIADPPILPIKLTQVRPRRPGCAGFG